MEKQEKRGDLPPYSIARKISGYAIVNRDGLEVAVVPSPYTWSGTDEDGWQSDLAHEIVLLLNGPLGLRGARDGGVAPPESRTATFVKRLTGGASDEKDQRLYRMNPPHLGHAYVVASANVVFKEPETYLFAADASGKIVDWFELDGSLKGTLQHADVFAEIGYRIVTEEA